MTLLLAAAPAFAASTVTVNAADGVEGATAASITVDVNADDPAGGTLTVEVQSGSGPCASGTGTVVHGPAGVPTGVTNGIATSYPATSDGSFIACAYLTGGAPADGSDTFVIAPPITMTVAADPPAALVEGRQQLFTLNVTANLSGRQLRAYVHPTNLVCPPSADLEETNHPDETRILATPAQTGTHTYTTGYAPPDARDYTFCFYAGPSASSTEATQQIQMHAGDATVSALTVNPPANAALGAAAAFAVDATIDTPSVSRLLWLVLDPANGACAATPGAAMVVSGTISLTLATGTPIGSGASSTPVEFTPSQAGVYKACAYVGGGADFPPDKTAEALINVRGQGTSLTISASPSVANPGDQVSILTRGNTDFARLLFVYEQPDGASCASTAAQQATQPGVNVLTPPAGLAIDGAISDRRTITMSDVPSTRICAYIASKATSTPDRVASLDVTRATGSGGGGGPTDLDIDPGRIPDRYGKQGQGRYYVNVEVLPAGVTASRFLTLVQRSAARWGYKYAGTTKAGAAKRDGKRVVGFTKRIQPSKIAGVISFRTKAKPKTKKCRKRSTGSCRPRITTVERDIALSRELGTWAAGPAHPRRTQVDVESALIRVFGQLAGNRAAAKSCDGAPLVLATEGRLGWWWRSPSDYFMPGCS